MLYRKTRNSSQTLTLLSPETSMSAQVEATGWYGSMGDNQNDVEKVVFNL